MPISSRPLALLWLTWALAACTSNKPSDVGTGNRPDSGPSAPQPSCTDSAQNGRETGIDCGGSCPACSPQDPPDSPNPPDPEEPEEPQDPQDSPPTGCASTTGIATSGYDICVDGHRFLIKGVNYDPTEIGDDHTRFDYDALFPANEDDAARLAQMNANTIRLYGPTSAKVAGGWLTTAHLDALYSRGIYVVLTVHPSVWDDFHAEAVQRFDSHPAVLMYLIGNEISHNKFYTYDANWDAFGLVTYTNNVAGEIRAAGATKPIAVSWGNPSDAHWPALRNLTVDIISYQIYEFLSFTTGTAGGRDIFSAHRQHGPAIPFFISEYGADAMNGSDGAPTEDQGAQAYADDVLTSLIKEDALTAQDGVSGGCVFSFSDGWWKAPGDAAVHDLGGIDVLQGSGPYPDSSFHEEYWGLTDVYRTPRQAYFAMQAIYATY